MLAAISYVLSAGLLMCFLALQILTEAYVAWHLWVWFMVPFGVPVASIAQLIGLNCLWALFAYRYLRKYDDEQIARRLCMWVLLVAMVFLVGYIASRWM